MSDLEHGSTVGGSPILTQNNLGNHTHHISDIHALGDSAYYNKSDSIYLNSSTTIATSAAVNSLRSSIDSNRNNISLSWGLVQITGYQNDWDNEVNWTAPEGCVMCGETSYHNSSKEDRRFRFRYRSLGINK